MTDTESVVLVDTDAFSVAFVHRDQTDGRYLQVRRVLRRRRTVIAFQTAAELMYGAQAAGWGELRTRRLQRILNRTPVIHEEPSVLDAYVSLRAECHRRGHALHQKVHNGDLWVAAAAIAKGLPVLSLDRVFHDAPGVRSLPL